jgi:cardiolipin synthase
VTTNPNLLSTVVLVAHWLIVIGLSVRVVARRLPVPVSLAWLAVIYSIPFAGAALYLVLGGKRLGPERAARRAEAQRDMAAALTALREAPNAASPAAGTAGESLHRHALEVTGAPVFGGNRLVLLQDSGAVFDALVRDIDAAEDSCRLAFYIWQDGGRADDVAEALLRGRRRGVRCRVLVDAVGSKRFLEGSRVRSLLASGVEVAGALPPSWRRRSDLRYHRKIVVIDDRLAYTGSQNLVDPRFFKRESGVGRWVDAVVRMEGPAVTPLATIFETDWCVETGSSFELPRPWPGAPERDWPDGDLVQVVPSGPAPDPDAIRPLLLTAIYSARRTLTLTTPYFVPDDAVLTALISAARRGVDVTVIVPARNDSFLVRYASAAPFDVLMTSGVRIALFQDGLLHTKSILVDGALTLFGSVNLDMRSFWLNFESSLFVYGPAFAARIGEVHRDYLARSVLVDAETWRRRPTRQQCLEDAARLVGPLL